MKKITKSTFAKHFDSYAIVHGEEKLFNLQMTFIKSITQGFIHYMMKSFPKEYLFALEDKYGLMSTFYHRANDTFVVYCAGKYIDVDLDEKLLEENKEGGITFLLNNDPETIESYKRLHQVAKDKMNAQKQNTWGATLPKSGLPN